MPYAVGIMHALHSGYPIMAYENLHEMLKIFDVYWPIHSMNLDNEPANRMEIKSETTKAFLSMKKASEA